MGPKWYQFGQAVGIAEDVLVKCFEYPPEECIVEVLDYWLRNFGPSRPTWRDVAKALRDTGLQQLSENILKVYETGNLMVFSLLPTQRLMFVFI